VRDFISHFIPSQSLIDQYALVVDTVMGKTVIPR